MTGDKLPEVAVMGIYGDGSNWESGVLLGGPKRVLRGHLGILEGLGDTFATSGGWTLGFCGARGMTGVVVPAPLGLNWAAGLDGSYRQEEKRWRRHQAPPPKARTPALIGCGW